MAPARMRPGACGGRSFRQRIVRSKICATRPWWKALLAPTRAGIEMRAGLPLSRTWPRETCGPIHLIQIVDAECRQRISPIEKVCLRLAHTFLPGD
jgi:hypothetical protein